MSISPPHFGHVLSNGLSLIIFMHRIRTLFSLTSWNQQSVQATSWTFCGDLVDNLIGRLNVLEHFVDYGPTLPPSNCRMYGPAVFHWPNIRPNFAPATFASRIPYSERIIVVNKISCYPFCPQEVAYRPYRIHHSQGTLPIQNGQYYGLGKLYIGALANLNEWSLCRTRSLTKSFRFPALKISQVPHLGEKCVPVLLLSKTFLPNLLLSISTFPVSGLLAIRATEKAIKPYLVY